MLIRTNALPILLLFLPISCISQKEHVIETRDISHFWSAYDQLKVAVTKEDSIRTIQEGYIDQASAYFKAFIKARDFTSAEYVALIQVYPEFWKSIRPLTERIASRKNEIETVFAQMDTTLPGFRQPDVCFAIGCLRTGGTTSKDLILIGAEIAAADESVEKSKLNPWLQSVLGKTGDIVSMVAHEAVHTQQSGFPFFELFRLLKHKKLSLMNMAIVEGSADFITMQLLGLNINAAIHAYGDQHQCALWKEFKADCETNPFDYSKWLYNGNAAKERPADLAYYIGSKISQAYYAQSSRKEKALRTLLHRGKYNHVVNHSGYQTICNQ
jgi:hypothetical protein